MRYGTVKMIAMAIRKSSVVLRVGCTGELYQPRDSWARSASLAAHRRGEAPHRRRERVPRDPHIDELEDPAAARGLLERLRKLRARLGTMAPSTERVRERREVPFADVRIAGLGTECREHSPACVVHHDHD